VVLASSSIRGSFHSPLSFSRTTLSRISTSSFYRKQNNNFFHKIEKFRHYFHRPLQISSATINASFNGELNVDH
jgi:hypothetical protein